MSFTKVRYRAPEIDSSDGSVRGLERPGCSSENANEKRF